MARVRRTGFTADRDIPEEAALHDQVRRGEQACDVPRGRRSLQHRAAQIRDCVEQLEFKASQLAGIRKALGKG